MAMASLWGEAERGAARAPRPIHQTLAPLRALMNVVGSRFSRLAARFSFSDILAVFLLSRSCGVFADIGTRFPSWLA